MPNDFAPVALDPLPVPKEQELFTPTPEQGPTTQVPAGAGYAGGTGQVANIASNFLSGWVKGKNMVEEKAMKKAQFQAEAAKSGWQMAGQTLNNLHAQGVPETDPRFQEAMKAASAAGQYYKDVMSKFVMPEEEAGKKKSVGGKIVGGIKKAMVPESVPQLFAQHAINALDTYINDPRLLLNADNKKTQLERSQNERGIQLNSAMESQAALYEKNKGKEPSQWSPEDQQTLQASRNQYSILSKGEPYTMSPEQMKGKLIQDVMGGQSGSWTAEQRQLAQSAGIVQGNNVSIVPDQASGNYKILVTQPDGKVVGSPYDTGIKATGTNADVAGTMRAQIDAQVGGLAYWYMKANPTATQEQATAWAVQQVSPQKALGLDQKLANTTDEAVRKLMNSVPPDQAAKFKNFVAQDVTGSGRWMLRSQVAPPTNEPWEWRKKYFGAQNSYEGGAKEGELANLEMSFRGAMRAALQRSDASITDQQIDTVLGQPVYQAPKAAGSLAPPPGTPGQASGLTPPPAAGPQKYVITVPGSQPVNVQWNQSQVEQLKKVWQQKGIQGTIQPSQ